ncbi:MAG: hypothetical protein AB7I27_02340 [Bacteriovoracaceae bacterium]
MHTITSTLLLLQTILCTPMDRSYPKIEIEFKRAINPIHPFIGTYEIHAALKIEDYKNNGLIIVPESSYASPNLKGQSSDDIYLRLWPQIEDDQFKYYTGKILINDHETKLYLRTDLICHDYSIL